MNGPNKRKRKRTLFGPWSEDARSRLLSIIFSIERSSNPTTSQNYSTDVPSTVAADSRGGEQGVERRGPWYIIAWRNGASEDADSRYQIIQFLERRMSEIQRFEDAVDVMTSVLVSAVRIRIQAGKSDFERINIGTTTNIAEIWNSTGEFWSWPFVKLCLLSRLSARLLQKRSLIPLQCRNVRGQKFIKRIKCFPKFDFSVGHLQVIMESIHPL
jgi:hypothetical protein